MSNLKIKNNESGRSMIEMLGVLAIIGVLSVGGIAGYSKAMMKYRINKTIEQVSLISQNVRTFFAAQKRYDLGVGMSINSDNTYYKIVTKAKLIPEEMWSKDGSSISVKNAFGGGFELFDESAYTTGASLYDAFVIYLYGLPQEACIELGTLDWGSAAGSGLISVSVGKNAGQGIVGCDGSTDTGQSIACPNGKNISVPMPIDKATTACDCNGDCQFFIKYK